MLVQEANTIEAPDLNPENNMTLLRRAFEERSLRVGDRTTFNARNLDSPFWKGAVRHHRAIVVGTALGESNKVGSTNEHYLMNAKERLCRTGNHPCGPAS